MKSALLLLHALMACASYPGYRLPLPKDIVEVRDISGSYKRWWRQIERCAKKRVPMRGVRFYIVANSQSGFWYRRDPMPLAGLALVDRGAIALATGSILDSMIVRHEILHLIASPEGHDSTYFRGLCKDLVICVESCAVAGSIPPDPLHP